MLFYEAVLHTPCLNFGWHVGKGLKSGGEEVVYSAGGEVAERVLQDGGICTGTDVTVSRKR